MIQWIWEKKTWNTIISGTIFGRDNIMNNKNYFPRHMKVEMTVWKSHENGNLCPVNKLSAKTEYCNLNVTV